MYGFTISPSFVPALSVAPLGEFNVPDDIGMISDLGQDNKFLSITVDERALYTLQQTTETLAHEVSHFVGDKNRCRPIRKECILRYVLEEFLEQFLQFYSDILQRDFPAPSWHKYLVPEIKKESVCDYANKLLEKMRAVEDYYCTNDTFFMMTDVKELISQLLHNIIADYNLWGIVSDFIWENLFKEKGKQGKYWAYIECRLGFDSSRKQAHNGQWLNQSISETEAKQIEFEVRRICQKALEEFVDSRGHLNCMLFASGNNTTKDFRCAILYQDAADEVCYSFKETFADMQAILLLNMNWQDYNRLLPNDLSQEIPIRKLAVPMALVYTGHWKLQEWDEDDSDIGRLIKLDPADTSKLREFRESGINRRLLLYLSKYLVKCAETIKVNFKNPSRENEIKKLREVYGLVSQYDTVWKLEDSLMDTISAFRQSIEDYTAKEPQK